MSNTDVNATPAKKNLGQTVLDGLEGVWDELRGTVTKSTVSLTPEQQAEIDTAISSAANNVGATVSTAIQTAANAAGTPTQPAPTNVSGQLAVVAADQGFSILNADISAAVHKYMAANNNNLTNDIADIAGPVGAVIGQLAEQAATSWLAGAASKA